MIPAACLLALTACGGSAAQPQGSAVQTTARQGDPCADYVRMVQRCIGTKMPQEDREDARNSLASFQHFQALATSAQCEARIRSKIRDDENDCYTEEAVKYRVQTPCTILTKAEIESAVHTPLGDPVHLGERCRYPFKEKPFLEPLTITVRWSGDEGAVKGAEIAQKMIGAIVANQTGIKGLSSGEKVQGIGDDAYFTVAGIHPTLTARKGDLSFQVEGAAREALITIAQTALPRLTPEPSRRR